MIEVTKNLTQVTISSAGVAGANGTSGTSGVSQDLSHLATTASFNSFTSSYLTDSASFDSRITAATNEQDLSHLATTASFNSFTSSNDSVIARILQATASLNSKTGSYATTGSSVRRIPGLETDGRVIVDSDQITTGTLKPSSVIVIGGGAVGCEFASYFRDLGAETTIVEMLPALVPLEDRDASKELTRAFTKRGIAIHVAYRIKEGSLVKRADGVDLQIEPIDGGEAVPLSADMLVVAAGRVPNSGEIGLENTEAIAERGFIKVFCQST